MNDKQQLAAMGEHMREMEESELRITKDARIGGVVFKSWVKVSTVIDAAYRAAEFYQPNPKAFESLVDAINRKSTNNEFKVPDGWKLVPVEPTADMTLNAMMKAAIKYRCQDVYRRVYKAMLAAAPEYKP